MNCLNLRTQVCKIVFVGSFWAFSQISFADPACLSKELRKSLQLYSKDATVLSLLVKDAPVQEALKNNPELAAYLVAKHHLDPGLAPAEAMVIEQHIESGFDPESQAELKALNVHVSSLLQNYETRSSASQNYNSTPQKIARIAKGLKAVPSTSRAVSNVIKRDLNTEEMDANLYAFYGYHTKVGTRDVEQRPWDKVPLADVNSSQITGMSVDEFSAILLLAKEVEDPIEGYSVESGSGFRELSPNLARFMGRNLEEYNYFKADPNSKASQWCAGGWCNEEKRHGGIFGNLYTKLTGRKLPADNPNPSGMVDPTLEAALKHLTARQSTEWNATSAYELLLAHSSGPLHEAIRNVMRDEMKHLTIFSAAGRYINGERPWGRRIGMAKVSLTYGKSHSENRTSANELKNPVTAVELVIAHVQTEKRMTDYLSTLPLKTLRWIFEVPTQRPVLPANALPVKEQAEREAKVAKSLAMRENLTNWPPEQRAYAQARAQFEEKNAALIDEITRTRIGGFLRARVPDSRGDLDVRDKIETNIRYPKWMSARDRKMLKEALIDNLRDYQIRNNRLVRKLIEDEAAASAKLDPITEPQ